MRASPGCHTTVRADPHTAVQADAADAQRACTRLMRKRVRPPPGTSASAHSSPNAPLRLGHLLPPFRRTLMPLSSSPPKLSRSRIAVVAGLSIFGLSISAFVLLLPPAKQTPAIEALITLSFALLPAGCLRLCPYLPQRSPVPRGSTGRSRHPASAHRRRHLQGRLPQHMNTTPPCTAPPSEPSSRVDYIEIAA